VHEHQRVLDYVEACHPDVVALLEVDQKWIESLAPLDKTFSHAMKDVREEPRLLLF
jgi:hypothetical protein